MKTAQILEPVVTAGDFFSGSGITFASPPWAFAHLDPIDLRDAIRAARMALTNSHRPYHSEKDALGVAVLSDRGIFKGCDVQNAAYHSFLNAVSGAINTTFATGARVIDAVIICGENPKLGHRERGQLDDAVTGPTPVIFCDANGNHVGYECFEPSNPARAKRFTEYFPPHSGKFKDVYAESGMDGLVKHATAANLEAFHSHFSLDRRQIPLEELTAVVGDAMYVSSNACCALSNYAVGAAILTQDGEILTGCNIETSHDDGICAERCAIQSGVALGKLSQPPGGFEDRIKLVVVYVPADNPACPCGQCRQKLVEFTSVAPVLAVCRSSTLIYAEALSEGNVWNVDCSDPQQLLTSVVGVGGFVPAKFGRANLF